MASMQPQFYGLIAGKASGAFAKNVNSRMENQIMKTWEYIEDLQKDVNTNGSKAIDNLHAILILDKGFNETRKTSNESKAATFNFLQGMFHAKELYGTHLIMFTQEQEIFRILNSQYEASPETKYEGTLILETYEDYTIKSIMGVFERPLSYLSYSDKEVRDIERELARQKKREEDRERRIEANRHFLKLVGEKEALETLIDTLQRQVKMIDKDIYSFAIHMQTDNLDAIEDEFGDSVALELNEQLKKLK